MAKKEYSIANGQIIVIVQDKYEVYEKPLPDGLDPSINWIGNFGIKENETGTKIKGKVPNKYEVEVPDVEGKELYFWDKGKKNKFAGQATKTKGNKKFRTADLDLGDPPVGWG
ncbi:MAG: hypothetical protein ISR58_08230 [Anaerolineales bacterium]|nr:hypothetical protein [Chloroflexota bacterium]MBL6981165.1 hypothetical protein [Anaerolineales bacterium]